jgi:hypothetical protein
VVDHRQGDSRGAPSHADYRLRRSPSCTSYDHFAPFSLADLSTHLQIRDCVREDRYSMSLAAGRYMETVGFMSGSRRPISRLEIC